VDCAFGFSFSSLRWLPVMGFLAARWKAGPVSEHLDEWGLGGRQFGTWITWFLVAGDFYTAYTVIAVPALVYAAAPTDFLRTALYDHRLSLRVRRDAGAVEAGRMPMATSPRPTWYMAPTIARARVRGRDYRHGRKPCPTSHCS